MQGGRHRAQNRDSNALGASHVAVTSLSCHCVWGCTLPIFFLLHAKNRNFICSIYLKPQRRSFINLYVGTRLCKYFFAFVSNGVVLQPSRATLCERAPARIRWCDRVLPRSPQVVFVAEIGHGRKGPVSQQIRVPCYLNGHEGVLRGGCLAVGIRVRCHSLSVNIRLQLISYHLSECGRCPCMSGVH